MRRVGLSVAVMVAVVVMGGGVGARAAEPGGPTILVDSNQVQPGQRLAVTLSGWKSRNVTLAVCGNLARRGSADCNVVSSQTVRLMDPPAPTPAELVIFAPPATCPCVVRASSLAQEEVAFAAVEVAGVAVGPVVGPVFASPVEMATNVRVAGRGFVAAVRSALGGRSGYRVTVTLRNLTAETVPGVALTGWAGRGWGENGVSFDIPSPGEIAPGQTWERDVRVDLPAPVLKSALWRVTASGAGEAMTAESVTGHVPVALILLASLLVGDVGGMVWCFVRRRRARQQSLAVRPRREVTASVSPVAEPVLVS